MLVGSQGAAALAVYAVAGLALGLAAEAFNRWVSARLCERKPCARALAPKLVVAAAAFVALQAAFPDFALDWQNTTPGVFFVGLFFGMQASLFADAQSVLTF